MYGDDVSIVWSTAHLQKDVVDNCRDISLNFIALSNYIQSGEENTILRSFFNCGFRHHLFLILQSLSHSFVDLPIKRGPDFFNFLRLVHNGPHCFRPHFSYTVIDFLVSALCHRLGLHLKVRKALRRWHSFLFH